MSPQRWREVDPIFQSATDLAPEERSAYLDAACCGDEELRREVESLLEHDTADTRMEHAVRQESVALLEAGGVPEHAGPYRLTGVIGRGGMGVVYCALRDDEVYCKQVAVKLVKRGMDVEGRIYVSMNGEGILLKSPNGTCRHLTLSNSGQIALLQANCP